jgi:hypothetical protein
MAAHQLIKSVSALKSAGVREKKSAGFAGNTLSSVLPETVVVWAAQGIL